MTEVHEPLDWKRELERRLLLLEWMSYRVHVPSLPDCKHINRKAWMKALEGFDIDELWKKHENWARQQCKELEQA